MSKIHHMSDLDKEGNESELTELEQSLNKELPERHKHRQVRSFVMRTGRMTDSQKAAYERHWPIYGLELGDGITAFLKACEGYEHVVFEIGFGMGDSLADMAIASPEKLFIGVEVHTPGVGRLLNRCEREGIENIRVYQEDAIEVLDSCIPNESLDCIQIYFPDPWHKKKHNKRRIVQPDFVQKLRSKLKLDGLIHLATDWENYSEQMMDVMSNAEGFVNQAGEFMFSPKPGHRPVTKFEKRGQRLGHGVWDLMFERCS